MRFTKGIHWSRNQLVCPKYWNHFCMIKHFVSLPTAIGRWWFSTRCVCVYVCVFSLSVKIFVWTIWLRTGTTQTILCRYFYTKYFVLSFSIDVVPTTCYFVMMRSPSNYMSRTYDVIGDISRSKSRSNLKVNLTRSITIVQRESKYSHNLWLDGYLPET